MLTRRQARRPLHKPGQSCSPISRNKKSSRYAPPSTRSFAATRRSNHCNKGKVQMYGIDTVRRIRAKATLWMSVSLLLYAAAAHAQVTVGDNVNLNLSGSMGYGYSGSFGNFDY